MIESRAIGSLIEIYENGGGYFTQVAPTEFRKVWKRKVLTAMEKVEDFREATAEEVRQYLGDAPAVETPGQWLIDEAAREGVPFNERTGFFEYNGLTDLTAANVNAMLRAGRMTHLTGADYFYYHGQNNALRTILQPHNRQHKQLDAVATFYNCNMAEVIPAAYLSPSSACFSTCTRLRRIIDTSDSKPGTIRMGTSYDNVFEGCTHLEEADLVPVSGLIDLSDSPNFKLESLRKMIVNAVNTVAMTIKVHPNLYAKITAEDVPVPGTDSYDWTDYRPNLLLNSDVVAENADYVLAKYSLGSLRLRVGVSCTASMWGLEIGEGKTWASVLDAAGYKTLLRVTPESVVDGFRSGGCAWPQTYGGGSASGIGFWMVPESAKATSRIERLKLTLGDDPNPRWTMCSDEIEDPELRERTQWRELLFLAAARKITIATRES